MEEDYKVLSLDKRIENNLKEIYENEIVPLKKIIEFVEQYKKFKLTGAVELSELFKTETDAETKKEEAISTLGLPGFFAGDRDSFFSKDFPSDASITGIPSYISCSFFAIIQ